MSATRGSRAPVARGARRRRQRIRPRLAAQLPYLLVLCGVAAGLTLVALEDFRLGSGLVAVSALGGALARLVLGDGRSGMLASRRRAADVAIMMGFAVGLAVMAWFVPGR